VLHHHTRKEQLAIWVNFANRTMAGTERLIGSFSHPHLLDIDLAADPTGRDLMHQVQATLGRALPHQHVPISLLWSSLGRSLESREGRIVFDVLHQGAPRQDVADSAIREVPIFNPMSFHLLSIRVYNTPEMVTINVGYSRRHLAQETVVSMAAQVRRCIEALTIGGERRASSYLSVPD
jgi:Condensation domain